MFMYYGENTLDKLGEHISLKLVFKVKCLTTNNKTNVTKICAIVKGPN